MRAFKDLTGQKFGRLTVIERAGKSNDGRIKWKCLCDCQLCLPEQERQYVEVIGHNMVQGSTKSCGCLHIETSKINGHNNKKTNKYITLNNTTILGYTFKNEPFWIDAEDYPIIAQYCWHRHQDGYMRTCDYSYKDDKGKQHNHYIMMHQLLHKHYYPESDLIFDHIDGNSANNRKSNLREVSHILNMKNLKLYSNNTSGYAGVFFSKGEQKWKAYITVDKCRIHLGTYSTLEEAINARKEAEKQYYYEYRRNHVS